MKARRKLGRWHIWLGWLIGVPLLLWTGTGLLMVSRPIEEVRGTHLRRDVAHVTIDAAKLTLPKADDFAIHGLTLNTDGDAPSWVATGKNDEVRHYSALTGLPLPHIGKAQAEAIVARAIVGGDKVAKTTLYDDPKTVPLDFRRPIAIWQVALNDGTHVYVGRHSGKVEAVRTRFWRIFDFAWGLHIMDLQTREDNHHPVLILFATLAFLGSILGFTLLFMRGRRKRA